MTAIPAPVAVPTDPKKIFIMDYWSDHNRGDAAMQVALIEMLRERYPDAALSVGVEYGTNQWADIPAELDHVLEMIPETDLHGGIRKTAYPIGGASQWSSKARAVRKILHILESFWTMFMISVLGRNASVLMFDARRKRAFLAIADADLVVWNGRNFRSRSAKSEAYDLWSLVYNPKVAHHLKRPIVSIGASCWKLSTEKGKAMVAKTLGRAAYVSAREDATYAYLKEILPTERATQILARRPDLSFGYLRHHKAPMRALKGDDSPITLAMTLVDWGESDAAEQASYLKALIDGVLGLAAQRPVKVRIVPQVPYGPQGYGQLLTDFKAAVEDKVAGFDVIDHKLSLQELVDGYKTADLLIGTRMHSVIFSWSVGTPAIGIAYDSGAKWNILRDLGVGDLIYPIGSVTADDLTGAAKTIAGLDADAITAKVDQVCVDVTTNITDWAGQG